MSRILVFLVAVLLQGVFAQDCIPDSVGTVTIDLNYVLHWSESTNCADTHYLVYVHIDIDNLQYIFRSDDTQLDVSFLPACERFHFRVNAYTGADNQLSEESLLEAYMPAPSGTDLTIDVFNIVEQEQGVLLEWQVNEKFAHCASAFRVVIRDDWFVPQDKYTQRPSLYLDNIVPCATYEFTVTAIYNQQSEGPIVLRRYEAPAVRTNPPDLRAVTVTSNSANMTYNVETYAANRCPITAILISGPFFTRTYELTDSPSRPPVALLASPLEPDRLYFMEVHVVNSAGTSAPLQVGIQTAPVSA